MRCASASMQRQSAACALPLPDAQDRTFSSSATDMTHLVQHPTTIRNTEACEKLLSLLADAVADLRVLGDGPVIVASCPARFNGVSNDVDWRAIRVGSFLSERKDYTERPEAHDKRLRDAPQSARAANLILERLETAGWRKLYQKACDRDYVSPEEVIALVIQNDEAWLVLCDSYSGESAVYQPAKGLLQIGCCDGQKPFDRCLGEIYPLTVRSTLNTESVDHSSSLLSSELMLPDRTGTTTKHQAPGQDRHDPAAVAQQPTILRSVGRQCYAHHASFHLYRADLRQRPNSTQAIQKAGQRRSQRPTESKMMRIRIAAFGVLMLLAADEAQARVLIVVDKNSQTMVVSVDDVERYQWPVSTGKPSHETPNGQFRAFRMEEDHYSKEFDDAPMPHSIFFTRSGHAIHGTDSVDRLGSPASHGCVRLSRKTLRPCSRWFKAKAYSTQRWRFQDRQE